MSGDINKAIEQVMKKGDTVIYHFGFRYQDAKITKVIGNYVKVRHNDFWGFLSYRDTIHTSEILVHESKVSKWNKLKNYLTLKKIQ